MSLLSQEDGSVVCTGYTSGYGEGNNDILMIKLNSAGALEWAKTFGTPSDDYSYGIESLPSGGYVMSAYSSSYGNYDFVLLTLSQNFESCSNLIANDTALLSLDVTSHADLIFQDIALTQDFSYAATIPYSTVTPTITTDILPQLSSTNGKDICMLAG